MSRSRGRRVVHQPRQTRPPQPPQIANTFQQALALHQQGQLAQAEPLYRTILKQAPDHFDALHLLGVIEYQRKNFAAAARLIGQALTLNPNSAPAQSNLGNALRQLDRHAEALASYDRSLAIKPDYADAFYNRGNVLRQLNRHEEALASYDRVLAITPDYAQALYNRGNALFDLRRYEEALSSYDHALALTPDNARVLSNRGNALVALKRHEAAADAFARLLSVQPDYNYVRGNLLYSQLNCCDWKYYNENIERIVNAVAAGQRATTPFAFLSVSELPNAQLLCSQIYSTKKSIGSEQVIWQGERYSMTESALLICRLTFTIMPPLI